MGADIPIAVIKAGRRRRGLPESPSVVDIGLAVSARPGDPDASSAPAAIAAIRRAVADVATGAARPWSPNPVAKNVLYQAGPSRSPATRIPRPTRGGDDGAAASSDAVVVARACGGCRDRIHLPLEDVVARLASELIIETGHIVVAHALARDFGIARPGWLHRRPQSARRRRRRHGPGRGASRGPPRVAVLGRSASTPRSPLPADTLFQPDARAPLRRGALPLPRPGADPGEDARLLGRGERDPRPADRAHLARPWHRLRHRRPRPGPARQPDRRHPPGRRRSPRAARPA